MKLPGQSFSPKNNIEKIQSKEERTSINRRVHILWEERSTLKSLAFNLPSQRKRFKIQRLPGAELT